MLRKQRCSTWHHFTLGTFLLDFPAFPPVTLLGDFFPFFAVTDLDAFSSFFFFLDGVYKRLIYFERLHWCKDWDQSECVFLAAWDKTDLQFRFLVRGIYGHKLWDFFFFFLCFFLPLCGHIHLLFTICFPLFMVLCSLEKEGLAMSLSFNNLRVRHRTCICPHLFLGGLGTFLFLLQHVTVAQVRGVDGQGHRCLTL